MPVSNERLKQYIDGLEDHLRYCLSATQQIQSEVQAAEGDSDLLRKFSFYLTPNLNHWINGEQAGNVKDLRSVLASRTTPPVPVKPEKKGKKK